MRRILVGSALALLCSTTAYPQNVGAPLWKNLRLEMPAEDVVAALNAEGVKSEVKIDKKTGIRFVQVSGKEKERYVLVGDARFEPVLTFTSNGLRSVTLDGPSSCDPIEASKLQAKYETLIKEKYPILVGQTGGYQDVSDKLSRTFRRYGNDDVHVDVGLDAEALSILSCVSLFRVRLNYQSAHDSNASLSRQKQQGDQIKAKTLDDL
jgi:hypothetical protein